MTNIKIYTVHDIKEMLTRLEKPLLVDCYADWCAPCANLSLHLDVLEQEKGDILDIVKLDVDDEVNWEFVRDHNVKSIPTLVLYQVGKDPVVTSTSNIEELKLFLKQQGI